MFRSLFCWALTAGWLWSGGMLAAAENWGHWRGPGGNGAAVAANPPTEFSGTENVAWKVAIPGRGSGSPVVWDDRVFVVSAVADDELVYIGSGFRGAFLGAFRPQGRGNIASTRHVAWTIGRDTPDVASPLLSDGRLYFYKGKSGLLTCLDAKTGKPHYTASRIPGVNSTYASPVAAGGYVYLTDRSGQITVIKDADTLEVVATNRLGEPVDATPIPVDDQLFIRSENSLLCISR